LMYDLNNPLIAKHNRAAYRARTMKAPIQINAIVKWTETDRAKSDRLQKGEK
jgi:hypothetical protein